MENEKLPWLTQPGNVVAYSIQAPGPHGPGYRLAGLPVSCRQLEADAGTIQRKQRDNQTETSSS